MFFSSTHTALEKAGAKQLKGIRPSKIVSITSDLPIRPFILIFRVFLIFETTEWSFQSKSCTCQFAYLYLNYQIIRILMYLCQSF